MRIKWTPRRMELVRQLWESGYPSRVIAERLDVPVTRNAVIGLIHRHGWERPMSWTPPPKEKSPEPKPKIKPPPPGGLPLERLKNYQCRWPSGDRAPYRFCGHPKEEGSSYCPDHARLSTPGHR